MAVRVICAVLLRPSRCVRSTLPQVFLIISKAYAMKNGPYILIVAPENYPGKKFRGRYAYEHSIVYWQHHNRITLPGEVIHHKNHDKHDNRIENLELISNSKHSADHQSKPWTYAFVECFKCEKTFRLMGSYYRARNKLHGNRIYCSRQCQYDGMRIEFRDKA